MSETDQNDDSASPNWVVQALVAAAATMIQSHQLVLTRKSGFLKRTGAHLARNLGIAMPLLLGVAACYVASAIALRLVESNKYGWGDAFYNTWLTMTTVGAHTPPVSVGGQVLIGIDAFVGIVFFGIIVWLVTFSMTPDVSITYKYDEAARQFALDLSPALLDAMRSAVTTQDVTGSSPGSTGAPVPPAPGA
jgi:hypothetical protein